MKKRCIIVLALVAFALAVGAGSVVIARHYYGQKLIKHVWPQKGLEGVAAPLPRAEGGILLIGDSRMAEWPLLQLAGLPVTNGAISGSTSAEMSGRLRRQLESNHPRIVIIEVGINDLKLIGVRPELKGAIISQCLTQIMQAIDLCREYNAQVFLFPVWPGGPVSPIRRLVWNESINVAVRELNERMCEEALSRTHVTLVPVFSEILQQNSSHPSELYRDTLHMKAETYHLLSEALNTLIGAWLKGK